MSTENIRAAQPSFAARVFVDDDLEVVSSGVVHLEGQEKVVFAVGHLQFEFHFVDDGGTGRFEGKGDGTTVTMMLFNHVGSLPQGKLKPIDVGTVNGRTLAISYSVSTLDAATKARILSYTWFLRGTVR